MKYLYVKFFRDMKSLWTQFLSVLMMALLSVAIFSGMSTVWNGMEKSFNNYVYETNLADAYVYGLKISDSNLNDIKKINYVSKAEASMSRTVDTNKVNGEESDLNICTFNRNTLTVMKPLVRSGSAFKDDLEGIWLDEDYAKAHSLKTGDKITIKDLKSEHKIEILGTVLHSENIYFVTSSSESVPNHEHHGYGYISEKNAEDIFGGIQYNQIRLTFKNGASVNKDELKDDMKNILKDSYYSSILRDDRSSITQVKDEEMQIKKMAILFSAVFILLAILTMYTTMSRLVNNQIVQIGTMKSMGFYNSQIYIHYGLFGFGISLLGSILGMALGYFAISNLVLSIKQATLTLPVWYRDIGYETVILIVLIVIICTLSSVITTRKVVKVVPSQTIRGIINHESKQYKELKRSKLSYGWLWILRSIKNHPTRYIMAVVAVAGSVVLMVAGIGVWDSLNTSYNDVFESEYTYKYVGNIRGLNYAQSKELFKDKTVQLARVDGATFTFGENEIDGVTSIIDNGNQVHFFSYESAKEIKLPKKDGAIITKKIAEKLKISVGDRVYYKIDNSSKTESIVIKEIINTKLPQGIFISAEAIGEYIPNTVYIGNEKSYDIAKKSSFVTGLISLEKQRENTNEMMESVHSIMYILILAAFILSAVILYNLGMLNYIERYRNYATMKVLGFYKKEITSMVLKDCLLTLSLGMVVGIPLSFKFLSMYVNIVSMDNMEWTPYISNLHYAFIISIIIIFSILINLIVCKKIEKINMVEALKSIE